MNALRVSYGIPDEKLFVAYNGVDTKFRDIKKVSQKEKNQISDQFQLEQFWTLLYFGHSGVSKGIDFLIEMIPILIEKYPDLKIIFNIIPAQRDKIINKKIQNSIHRLDPKDQSRIQISHGLKKEELRALLANVDGVIAPSLSEGFGSVHTETLALQTPLITTRVSAIPEVV